MAIEPYETKVIDGKEHWGVPCWVPKESDPERGAYIFFAKPLDGVAGIGGLIKGDPGKHTEFQTGVNLTPLEPGDSTPDSASLTVITPGSDTVSQVMRLNLALHKGAKGDDGDTVLTPSDYGTPVAKRTLAVNSGLSAFELVQPKVGGVHWAASLSNAPGGTTSTFTIGTITVASGVYLSDWRPIPAAGVTVTGSTSDIRVDIFARLGSASGPIVGRGRGVAGVQTQRVTMVWGPPAGTSPTDTTFYVAAGAAATVYLVAEKQSGAATYSTSEPDFTMKAAPLP